MSRYFYGSNHIDANDYPREGRQGIDSIKPRAVGQQFNAKLSLKSKIGSVFSLFFEGKRYGSARVIGEPCNNSKYQVEMQRGGELAGTNMAEGVYTFEVEHSDFCNPEDVGDLGHDEIVFKPKGHWDPIDV